MSDILDATDSGKVTLLGLLDLSAAFDTVDHDILLTRLEVSYGLTGTVLQWMESFVKGRTQTVVHNGQHAPAVSLLCGVPQGSVLGPLLFVLYTADVCDIATAHGLGVHAYADDVQLYNHCHPRDQRDTAARFSSCVAEIKSWMDSNRLKLNSDKTETMWLGSRQKLQQITVREIQIGDDTIRTKEKLRNLGVIFDEELSFVQQANAVAQSGFYHLRQLWTVRRVLSTDVAKTLVNAFVANRVDYCNSMYYGSTDAVHRKLQSVLNAAARLVTGARKFDRITPSLRDLHWLRVRERVLFKEAVTVRQALSGHGPEYLRAYLTPLTTQPPVASAGC